MHHWFAHMSGRLCQQLLSQQVLQGTCGLSMLVLLVAPKCARSNSADLAAALAVSLGIWETLNGIPFCCLKLLPPRFVRYKDQELGIICSLLVSSLFYRFQKFMDLTLRPSSRKRFLVAEFVTDRCREVDIQKVWMSSPKNACRVRKNIILDLASDRAKLCFAQ